MATVTKIRVITNNSLYAIQIINGENSNETFSIDAGAGWTGEIWIPWVASQDEMNKAIEIVSDGETLFFVFQDYNDSTDQIKYYSTRSYPGISMEGASMRGGKKTLSITSTNKLKMHKV